MSVEFVDELPKMRRADNRGAPLRAFAAVLRENPGRWAKHPTSFPTLNAARNSAYYINSGRSRSLPASEFEATARDGVAYVRYTGGVA